MEIMLRRLGLATIAFSLAACGFRPLYSDPDRQLGVIEIPPPPGEGGYAFRQALIQDIGAAGADAPYAMEITWRESIRSRSRAIDSSINFLEAVVTADYRIVRRADGVVIAEGVETVTSGFDAPSQQFAVRSSRRAAFERAAEEAAAIIGNQAILALRAQ